MTDAEFVVRMLQNVVGGTVTGARIDDEGFPVIAVEKDGAGFWLTVQRDAEGNGPGWVEVVPDE